MSRSLLALALASWMASAAVAAQSGVYGVGKPLSPDDIARLDTAIGPSGLELPPGSATAAQGQAVYTARCAGCHGATGREGPNDVLAGGVGSLKSDRPVRTVGSYWPYATTLFDYIRRAMPYSTPGALSDADVYGVTVYVLFLNGLVGEREPLDGKALTAIRMPNRDGFVNDPRPDVGASQKR